MISRTSRSGASPKHVILCTDESIALKHRPSAFVTFSSKKKSTLRKTCQQSIERYPCLDLSQLHLSNNNTSRIPALTATTSTGSGHIRVSYNLVYVVVHIRGSKPGCIAATRSKKYKFSHALKKPGMCILISYRNTTAILPHNSSSSGYCTYCRADPVRRECGSHARLCANLLEKHRSLPPPFWVVQEAKETEVGPDTAKMTSPE
jgi:hypothetical protein